MVTKKVYNQQKRYSANGTGKCNLKIVFQNGGNKTHTYDMIENIETMLDQTRPHVLFMCENRMDEKTFCRLTNRHGFSVEEMGPPESRPKERIWAAIKSTVPYTRLRECEERGLASLWLQFGTGASRYVVRAVVLGKSDSNVSLPFHQQCETTRAGSSRKRELVEAGNLPDIVIGQGGVDVIGLEVRFS